MDNSKNSNKKLSNKPSKKSFKPNFEEDFCKGCLICVYACEKFGGKVLKESKKMTDIGGILPMLEGNCIGCRWCERFCPDFAISVEEFKIC